MDVWIQCLLWWKSLTICPGMGLFNIYINDLHKGIGYMAIRDTDGSERMHLGQVQTHLQDGISEREKQEANKSSPQEPKMVLKHWGRINSNNKIAFHWDTCKFQHFVYNDLFNRLRMTVNETETVLMMGWMIHFRV